MQKALQDRQKAFLQMTPEMQQQETLLAVTYCKKNNLLYPTLLEKNKDKPGYGQAMALMNYWLAMAKKETEQ